VCIIDIIKDYRVQLNLIIIDMEEFTLHLLI